MNTPGKLCNLKALCDSHVTHDKLAVKDCNFAVLSSYQTTKTWYEVLRLELLSRMINLTSNYVLCKNKDNESRKSERGSSGSTLILNKN